MAKVFDEDTAVRALEGAEGHFEADVSPDWSMSRGPHGGYLAAIILRALIETVGDPQRAARSFTIHFARSPQPGAVQIAVKLERSGRSLSTLSARMEQEGKLIALTLGAFSLPWSAPEIDELPMPQVAPPDAQQGMPEAFARHQPPFMSHVVMQPRLGSAPFSSGDGAMEMGGWLGLRHPRPIDALALAFYCDAWIPAPFVRLDRFMPVPTIDLTVHFRAPSRPSNPQELVLTRVRCGLIQEGFFEEDSVIWAADGTVLAQSRQLGIVIPSADSG